MTVFVHESEVNTYDLAAEMAQTVSLYDLTDFIVEILCIQEIHVAEKMLRTIQADYDARMK